MAGNVCNTLHCKGVEGGVATLQVMADGLDDQLKEVVTLSN